MGNPEPPHALTDFSDKATGRQKTDTDEDWELEKKKQTK